MKFEMKTAVLPIVGGLCILAATGFFLGAISSEATSKNVPETIIIDNIKGLYSAVKFDHKKHLSLAGSCGKCHHTHTQKTYAECNRCHSRVSELFKAEANHSFMPCANCHKDHDLQDLSVPSLKVAYHQVCFKCHVGIGEIGSSPAGCTKVCHTRAAGKQ
jgi:hypothetical protein